MMPDLPALDPAILAAAATQDDTIRANAARLVAKVMKDVEFQLDHGTPASRLLVQQKILPILMKQLDDDTVNDEIAMLRAEVQKMRDETRQALLGAHVMEVGE